jgi:hypothetical protein
MLFRWRPRYGTFRRGVHRRAVSDSVTALPPYFANPLGETEGGGASGSRLVSSNRHALCSDEKSRGL